VMDPGLLVPMSMANSGGSGTQTNQTRISIPSALPAWSWAAKGGDLSSPITVTSSAQTFGWGAAIDIGDPSERVATISGNGGRHTVFRYPTFSQLANGFFNPGPRSFFFATRGAANVLNAAGARLLDQVLLATDI
jgi:hypothetical protein